MQKRVEGESAAPKLTEREIAIKVAEDILETPYNDPDGDMCILSRQFLRAIEREDGHLRRQNEAIAAKYGIDLDNLPELSEAKDPATL